MCVLEIVSKMWGPNNINAHIGIPQKVATLLSELQLGTLLPNQFISFCIVKLALVQYMLTKEEELFSGLTCGSNSKINVKERFLRKNGLSSTLKEKKL